MGAGCLVRSSSGVCKRLAGGAREDVKITAAVGVNGSNRSADVRAVQQLLNEQAAPPAPLLVTDGIVGRLTTTAIKNFQAGVIPHPDGRVDPNGRTLAALNTRALGPVTKAGGTASNNLVPDFIVDQFVLSLLRDTRAAIRKAHFHCLTAAPYVPTTAYHKGDPIPPQPAKRSIEFLHNVFGILKLPNPRAGLANITRVYANMQVALNRTYETDPLASSVLFVANKYPEMEKIALAYTSMGGAYASPKLMFDYPRLPVNRIYICTNVVRSQDRSEQIVTLIHELAHFVSGQPMFIIDHQNGDMAADRKKFDALPPEKKIRNAEHYGFFATALLFNY